VTDWLENFAESRICPEKSKRPNVFGPLPKDNDLQSCSTTGTICPNLTVAFPDGFSTRITQKTVVVLDNARIHHSGEYGRQMARWEQQDSHVFSLPTYRPHLNLIERLRLKVKYEWPKPQDYQSFEMLNDAVETILNRIGKKLKTDFNGPKHFTEFKTAFN